MHKKQHFISPHVKPSPPPLLLKAPSAHHYPPAQNSTKKSYMSGWPWMTHMCSAEFPLRCGGVGWGWG